MTLVKVDEAVFITVGINFFLLKLGGGDVLLDQAAVTCECNFLGYFSTIMQLLERDLRLVGFAGDRDFVTSRR